MDWQWREAPCERDRPGRYRVNPAELGWGDSIEVENGAGLLFPWLGGEDGGR
jgi:hypothetical protein